MGFQEMSTEILDTYEDSHVKLQELNSLYKRISTLLISVKKKMRMLFRTAIEQDIKMLDAVKAFVTKKVTSTKKSQSAKNLYTLLWKVQSFQKSGDLNSV